MLDRKIYLAFAVDYFTQEARPAGICDIVHFACIQALYHMSMYGRTV